ncbi:MAG: PIN domain-containing protein [Candidatus Nanopelagicales bacterium]
MTRTGRSVVVLDSGGLSRLSIRDRRTAAILDGLRREGQRPLVVPTMVLTESLTGLARDANTNRLLALCDIRAEVPMALARRAAALRHAARRGSAVDALVVALAEPFGTVLTSDPEDLTALAAQGTGVSIEVV